MVQWAGQLCYTRQTQVQFLKFHTVHDAQSCIITEHRIKRYPGAFMGIAHTP